MIRISPFFGQQSFATKALKQPSQPKFGIEETASEPSEGGKKRPFWERFRPEKDAATSIALWQTLDRVDVKIAFIQALRMPPSDEIIDAFNTDYFKRKNANPDGINRKKEVKTYVAQYKG